MPAYGYVVLAGTVLWLAPFFVIKRDTPKAERLDRRARWGVLCMLVAYSALWQSRFWERSPHDWQVVLSVFCFVFAILLSWTSIRALGRHWRIDAGLHTDHELVTSGPYSVVRHPIYTSMLCMLCATGFVIAPMPILLLALIVFVIGIEIRVRIEDALLSQRFGEQFRRYQQRVPAYVPFLR